MKAVSLWQPWATLFALRIKTIETRGWATSHRGPIAIHAAKRVTGRVGQVTEIGEYCVERDRAGLLLRGPGLYHPYRLPLGAIVATANLTDCIRIVHADQVDELPAQPLIAWSTDQPPALQAWAYDAPIDITAQAPYGDYTAGRWAWMHRNIQPVNPPVPARGRQGLWNLDDELLPTLRERR